MTSKSRKELNAEYEKYFTNLLANQGAKFISKEGQKVTRAGWNGKDMFLVKAGSYSVLPENLRANSPITAADLKTLGATELNILPHIDMWTAQKTYMAGWTPSQIDLFAEDWMTV